MNDDLKTVLEAVGQILLAVAQVLGAILWLTIMVFVWFIMAIFLFFILIFD